MIAKVSDFLKKDDITEDDVIELVDNGINVFNVKKQFQGAIGYTDDGSLPAVTKAVENKIQTLDKRSALDQLTEGSMFKTKNILFSNFDVNSRLDLTPDVKHIISKGQVIIRNDFSLKSITSNGLIKIEGSPKSNVDTINGNINIFDSEVNIKTNNGRIKIYDSKVDVGVANTKVLTDNSKVNIKTANGELEARESNINIESRS